MADKIIAIMSGGLDSTTLVYGLLSEKGRFDVDCVSFDYGQKHSKELEYAAATCAKLGLRHDIIDLRGITKLLGESGSSLVSDTPVPEGHYAEENMKATVVPNRNMMMLSIAGGVAVARSAAAVATGVHAGDHFIYPDCRPEFVTLASQAMIVGNQGFGNPNGTGIIAPFMSSTKEDIAYEALQLGLPLHETWSCYKGGEMHCGKCGTCVERLEAINGAVNRWLKNDYVDGDIAPWDQTEYEDVEFWRTAVNA
jgi:7-cyano-7-deazaguanine synthase